MSPITIFCLGVLVGVILTAATCLFLGWFLNQKRGERISKYGDKVQE